MDERTSVLVCLGAATAANCVPCFEHYLNKAKVLDSYVIDLRFYLSECLSC
jgi:alkylhydroperoxidase/carboxymuconolactone decarboxylase family protein YurZ